MKIKVAELINRPLNWVVATCEGYTNLRKNPHRFANDLLITSSKDGKNIKLSDFSPSTGWSHGGKIIERERIQISPQSWCWHATRVHTDQKMVVSHYGPTPLIAAMRCFVASKLGDEVDVPDELLGD